MRPADHRRHGAPATRAHHDRQRQAWTMDQARRAAAGGPPGARRAEEGLKTLQYGLAPKSQGWIQKKSANAATPSSGRSQPISRHSIWLRPWAIARNGICEVAAAKRGQSGSDRLRASISTLPIAARRKKAPKKMVDLTS